MPAPSHKPRLIISDGKVYIGDRSLKLSPKAYDLLSLCLQYLESDVKVIELDEVIKLNGWLSLSHSSAKTELYRIVKNTHVDGIPLFKSPPRAKTRLVGLNPDVEFEILDPKEVELARKENLLPVNMAKPTSYNIIKWLDFLVKIEEAFEKGQHRECIERCLKILSVMKNERPHFITAHAYGLALWSSAYLPDEIEVSAIEEDFTKFFKEIQLKLSVDNDDNLYDMKLWLVTYLIRYRIIKGRTHEISGLINVLEDGYDNLCYRRKCSLSAAKGFIHQTLNELEKAYKYYTTALEYASKAFWRWGVHVQLNNVGSVLLEIQATSGLIELDDAETPEAYYSLAADLAISGNYGGAYNLVSNVVKTYLREGRLTDAKRIVEFGQQFLNSSLNDFSHGMFMEVSGDLACLEFDHEHARACWAKALFYYRRSRRNDHVDKLRSKMKLHSGNPTQSNSPFRD